MRQLTVMLFIASFINIISSQSEDFGFDQENGSIQILSPLKRLWGIPDAKTQVGKYFKLDIPNDAFNGPISKYEANIADSEKSLPGWLRLDPSTGTLEGVPSEKDIGEIYVALKAIGIEQRQQASDYFAIEVLPFSYSRLLSFKERCLPDEDVTTVTVVLDKDYSALTTGTKLALLTNLANYLGISTDKLSLIPQRAEDMLTDSAIAAGPGNVLRKTAEQSSVVKWQVGCGGKVLPEYSPYIQRIKHDAYDGTLAEVMQLPVIGWHLSLSSANSPYRHRRQIVGSGDSENDTEDFDILDEDIPVDLPEEDVDETTPDVRKIPIAASPVFAEPSTSVKVETPHPHRHHHGEEPAVSVDPTYTSLLTSPAPFATIMPTPTYDPERPAVLPTILVTPSSSQMFEEYSVVPTPVISQVEPSVTPEMSTPQETDPLVVDSSSERGSTESLTTAPPPIDSTTTTKPLPDVLPVENTPPVISHKLPRQVTTAGKPFRYVIPETVFIDAEDGNTRKLHLTLKSQDGTPLHLSWLIFNPENQEVIALPLEEHVSRWAFVLEARDSEGLVVSDTLELTVQHDRGRRTVTHALTLDLALQSTPPPVEWQLTLVERLAALYGDPDTNNIIVLGVTPQDDPITFTWTNDSLPRNHCPHDQIDHLLKVLKANEEGKPTDPVRNLLSPQITVVRASWMPKGTCEPGVSKPSEPLPPTMENFSPSPRNQVDLLNATLGQLLVYTVPEDTFYDPEDGNTRNLKLSLQNMDTTPIPPSFWLQFDTKNQEFYGIPMATSDIGKFEYQLVCKDSGGLTVYDSLIVVVDPPAKILYNAEFSMTLDIQHDSFAYNPAMKRHFVERLAELFGDKNASSIVLSGVTSNPTLIVWHNRTLPTNICPHEEIKQLRQILLGDNDKVSAKVNAVLGPEFPVIHASLIPMARCQGAPTVIHPIEPVYPGDIRQIPPTQDEYLVTVIVPAVVIAGMLLCAGLVACILYRRRRTGKMSVGSEDERQSFRSKGIPVIFQDELEERPEPANKSPVIMKEEKPPLPPPEYHQRTALLSDTDHHEDSPYQPPPPFASSRDSARPKPTPTYRMPPPIRTEVSNEYCTKDVPASS